LFNTEQAAHTAMAAFLRIADDCKMEIMRERTTTKVSSYVLGHADQEIERLRLQAGIIGPVTRRLIHECGIGRGMRVLDIGCGVGDVSMLVAEAVGATGTVVAYDREASAIEIARSRALEAGYTQIEFVVASDETFPKRAPFDAAIGRYILHHQADPTAMIRRAASTVRPGGIVAFHELAGHIDTRTFPAVDLLANLEKCQNIVLSAMLPHRDVGNRLIACFEDAGLPAPRLTWESIAGGHDSPLWELCAMTYRSILPHITRLGLALADDGNPDTLADRLRAAATVARAQIVSKPQCCAWVIRP
jgi:2-polyprenyl-3-methyl-5-hydroxy-6-metoxy-1,4-benzoquinol methylase